MIIAEEGRANRRLTAVLFRRNGREKKNRQLINEHASLVAGEDLLPIIIRDSKLNQFQVAGVLK